MLIVIKDNFLSENTCENLIHYFEDNKHKCKKHRDTLSLCLDLQKNFIEEEIKKINNISNLINNSIIDYIEIVKWPENSFQNLHFDEALEKTTLTSICYLNDNYKEGQTYFKDGTIINPKKSRILFFDGKYYFHGVKKIEKGIRYTLAAWYKNINNI